MHEPHELLTQEDMDLHRVLKSIIEEIEAVDWYYQRAAATNNPLVRKLVLHNAHEEIEHALLGIEYLRRTSPVWSDMIDEYIYQDGELMEEYNEDGLEKEGDMIKEALVKMGMEKISHNNYNFYEPYLKDVDEWEEGIRREAEESEWNSLVNEGDLEKFRKWKNETKPMWDDYIKERKNDPKVQKFESVIEQAEGERKKKLQNKLEEYVNSNIKSPIDKDGKYQGLKKKLDRAKRKEYPNDRFLPEGKRQFAGNVAGKGALGGAVLGGLGGAALGGRDGIADGLVGGIAGTIAGAGLGMVGGAATSPLFRPFSKNKAKYNKEGVISKRKDDLYDREQYLRQGHNISY